MAKWVYSRPNDKGKRPLEYKTLGFTAKVGDILEADAAPDRRWVAADSSAVETVARGSAPWVPQNLPEEFHVKLAADGLGMLFDDNYGTPIFQIPPYGGPKTFGDSMGVWTGVYDNSVSLTPWGAISFGQSSPKRIFTCTDEPLDAETIDQMDRINDGGYIGGVHTTDARAKGNDLCISTQDARTVWRCLTDGTWADPEGEWIPLTVPSCLKTVTNHSTSGDIEPYEEQINAYNTITLTLPPLADCLHGRIFSIKNTYTGTITVNTSGSEVCDGSASAISMGAYDSLDFMAMTTTWSLV